MISNMMSRGMFKIGGVSVVLRVSVETCIGSHSHSIVMVAILEGFWSNESDAVQRTGAKEKLAFQRGK